MILISIVHVRQLMASLKVVVLLSSLNNFRYLIFNSFDLIHVILRPSMPYKCLVDPVFMLYC